MTLEEIASWINQVVQNKLQEDQIVVVMDAVQRLGFDETMEAFKVFEAMDIYQTLTFVSAGYTNAIASDVGKAVVGAGGKAGTLISYDNTARTWVVLTDDDFTDGSAVTLTGGTGAGTLAATGAQTGFKGPYAWPAYSDGETKVRKLHGVTTVSDAAIFGSETEASGSDDYGMLPLETDARMFFVAGRPDDDGETFTFINTPSRGDAHRWVYWREPPAIVGLVDNATLRIPRRYHFNFMQACLKCAMMTIERRVFTRADVEEDFGPWWESLRKKYTPNGRARNLTQRGNQSPDVLV